MTTGSSVERIAAAEGPTRSRPAKNAITAPTVDTSAIAASQPQPSAANPSSGPPVGSETSAKVTVAPVQTSAESASGGVPASTRSPTRM